MFEETLKKDIAVNRMRKAYEDHFREAEYNKKLNDIQCTCCLLHPRSDIPYREVLR